MTTETDTAENLKTVIDKTSKSYKEAVHAIVQSNSGYLKIAMDSNKNIIDSMEEQFQIKNIDHAVIDDVKNAMSNSMEMSEETIDTVIDSYNKQVESAIDFNSKLAEMINDMEVKYPSESEKLMKLIQANFESFIKLSTEGMNKIVDSYNRHTNLALNFNKTFGKSINSQMDAIQQVQTRNMDSITRMASEWVKKNA